MFRQTGNDRRSLSDSVQRKKKRVDDSVAGHLDMSRMDSLPEQVVFSCLGWAKMQGREAGCQNAIGFLRPRSLHVSRAQTRFNMAYRHFAVKSRERSAQDRGRVALHKN